jgi:diguanylate cyclase (GGDEF)-like protein
LCSSFREGHHPAMRLGVKLALLLSCASAAPLALATVVTLPSGSRQMRSQVGRLHAQAAAALADQVQRVLLDKLDALTLATRSLRLADLDQEARQQALLLIYQQTKGADVVGLFDDKGDPVVTPVRFSQVVPEAQQDHEEIDQAALNAYAAAVPLRETLRSKGLTLGPPYVLPGRGGAPVARLVLALPVHGPRGARWVLAVELSLRSLQERFEKLRPTEGSAFLVDSAYRAVIHPDPNVAFSRADLSTHPLLSGADQEDVLGASADVPVSGWRVVVQEDADAALGPIRRLARHAAFWIGLALAAAAILAVTTVRSVTTPVERLRAAAAAVAAGQLETEVEVRGHDELAQLAEAFNEMVRGLRERVRLEATLAISSTLELKEVLQRLLDGLSRLVPYQRAAVLMKRGDRYRVAAQRGYPEAEHAGVLEQVLPGGPVERALKAEQPALGWGGSALVIPLTSRGEVVGLVALESNKTGAYDDEKAHLAMRFTQPAVIAVENARLFDEVQRLATLDGLTGTHNRRHFMELAQLQYESARRFAQPLTAIMIDVDRFKEVNDTFGHAVGDQVLRTVADRVRRTLRAVDILGRTGGEEFAVLLPGTVRDSASTVLAERIRRAVGDEPILTDAGPVRVTISLGVASAGPECPDLAALLRAADDALYEAKESGRNRVAS